MAPQRSSPANASAAEVAAWLRVGLWEEDGENPAPTPKLDLAPPEDLLALPRYRVCWKIGEGGFGEVWAAEQIDPVHRKVALKVLKPGMDTRQVISRFNQERQTLAIMDHPGIAAIYDGGATSTGRPYFVMERVEGLPLTKYCDQHSLTIRARLELFSGICQAVHHAHQKGVLHRDLKPSNILVTEVDDKPAAKVIDFGIAKIIGGEMHAAGDSLLRTRDGWILGTPAYISPEQVMLGGIDLDTRADIYSLGVLLYELLTGRTPLFEAGTTSMPVDEWAHRIRNVHAKRPSVLVAAASAEIVATRGAVHAPAMARQVQGDLDWITLKALEKDREKRYDSAAALAEDLRRHLADEPVSAARPSAREAAWKFAKRNRGLVTATAASLFILIAALIFSMAAFVREARMRTQAEIARKDAQRHEEEAERQRDLAIASASEARTQEQRAEKILDYLDELLTRAGEFASRGANPEALRLALDEVTLKIPSFTADAALRETILGKSALIYRAIGHEDKAIPLVKAQLAIAEAKYGLTAPVTLEALDLYARSLSLQERHEEAVAQSDEMVRRWTSLPQDDPHTAEETFQARRRHADILKRAGRIEEAMTEASSLMASSSVVTKHSPDWNQLTRFYASLLRESGHHEEAGRLLDEVLAQPFSQKRVTVLQEKSRLQRDLGDLDGCIQSLLESIACEEKSKGAISRTIAPLHVEVSRPLDLQNLNDTAVEHCQKAVQISLAVDDRPKVLASTRALAENLENACRFLESAKAWQESAAMQKELGDQLIDRAFAARNLARAGRVQDATTLTAEINNALPNLPQSPALGSYRKLVRTATAYAQAVEFAGGQKPVPAEWRLLVSQLAEEDLRSFESPGKQAALPERVQRTFAQRHSKLDGLRPSWAPDAHAVLAFDRAITDRWMSYDATGTLFHLAACFRLQGRPDLAVDVYQAVVELPPSTIRIPGRQCLAKLHQAACLIATDRRHEAEARMEEIASRLHQDGHLPASPMAVELFNRLQSHLALVE